MDTIDAHDTLRLDFQTSFGSLQDPGRVALYGCVRLTRQASIRASWSGLIGRLARLLPPSLAGLPIEVRIPDGLGGWLSQSTQLTRDGRFYVRYQHLPDTLTTQDAHTHRIHAQVLAPCFDRTWIHRIAGLFSNEAYSTRQSHSAIKKLVGEISVTLHSEHNPTPFVCSDLDHTLVETNIRDIVRGQYTWRPGMRDLCRDLAQHAVLSIVTSSPETMHPEIINTLRQNDIIPSAGIHAQNWKKSPYHARLPGKLETIFSMANEWPKQRQVILIGDNTHSDPLIYRSVTEIFDGTRTPANIEQLCRIHGASLSQSIRIAALAEHAASRQHSVSLVLIIESSRRRNPGNYKHSWPKPSARFYYVSPALDGVAHMRTLLQACGALPC